MLPASASARLPRLWAVLAILASLSACYNPERDLIQDPFNTSLIHILDSGFEASTGSVALRWEYLGRDPLLRVIVLRRSGSGFDSIGVVQGGTSVGAGRFVDSYSDGLPLAGELLEYTVSARSSVGLVEARAIQVQIPGARLLRLRRNPFQGQIQVDWQSVGDGLSFLEVTRKSGAEDRTLKITGPAESSFIDTDIQGNVSYSYNVLTGFSTGASLGSSPLTAEIYSRERGEPVGRGASRTFITSGSSAASVTMLALVGRPIGVDISKYRYFFGASFDGSQTVGAIREETVATDVTGIVPESAVLAGPTVFRPPTIQDRVFLVGISSQGATVQVRAYSLPNLTKVWEGPDDWSITDMETPVAATQSGDGNIYLSADRRLRVFTSNLFELVSYDLPFAQPASLIGDSAHLWAAVPAENRVVRADVSGGLGPDLVWEDIDFGISGLSPSAITLNRFGQIFVLDASARRVYVFDTDLTSLLFWELPNEDFSLGGLALDGGTGNLVHVSSTGGNVFTYLP